MLAYGEPGLLCDAVDLWEGEGPAPKGLQTAEERGGKYDEIVFADRVGQIIGSHNVSVPLFIYYAQSMVHAPFTAPEWSTREYESKRPFVQKNGAGASDRYNVIYNTMVMLADAAVGNVTRALKASGMWGSSLIIWSSDNGGQIRYSAASNHPLRGGKSSNWEGGTRVPMVVAGGVLPLSQRGRTLPGPFHIIDWYQTLTSSLLAPAGGDSNVPVETAENSGPVPVESIDMWPYLSGNTTSASASPREDIVYGHRLGKSTVLSWRQYKLVASDEGVAAWYGEPSHRSLQWRWRDPTNNFTATSTGNAAGVDIAKIKSASRFFPAEFRHSCSFAKPCVFDVDADKQERVDLLPSVATTLQQAVASGSVPSVVYGGVVFPADCAGVVLCTPFKALLSRWDALELAVTIRTAPPSSPAMAKHTTEFCAALPANGFWFQPWEPSTTQTQSSIDTTTTMLTIPVAIPVAAQPQTGSARPHILLLIADDLGRADVGFNWSVCVPHTSHSHTRHC